MSSSCFSSFFHARLRTASLRSDYEGQAVLLNLLLRNYLSFNLFEQADKLVSKSTFPETATNNEWARFLYYLGKCKVVKLVPDAFTCIFTLLLLWRVLIFSTRWVSRGICIQLKICSKLIERPH